MTAFIGEIRIFGGYYAPQGWALCDGQILPIAGNSALYNVIGTTYGGNGVTTFALPDLRGRVPIQPGQGPGLALRMLGESAGVEAHALGLHEMPAHTHAAGASSANGAADAAGGGVPARAPSAIPQYAASADASLAAGAVGTTGAGQPHFNMQPYLVINYIIALQGVQP